MQSKHGGNVYAAARACGVTPDEILDFSASINPLGISPRFKKILGSLEQAILHYPDPDSADFIAALADYHGLPHTCFMAGNGSTEFIYLLPDIIRPKSVLICAPAFSEYEYSYQRQKGVVFHVCAREHDDFALPENEIRKQLKRGYCAVYIGNPSTPAGVLTPLATMRGIIACAARHGTVVIADEAFIEFREEHSCKALVQEFDNLYVLRSMTKFFGLPGLRCGYLISEPRNLERIRDHQQPWSINGPAQRAGMETLQDSAYIQKTLTYVANAKKDLLSGLQTLPYVKTFPGIANFILVKLDGSAPVTTARLAEELMHRGLLIRTCENFHGLDADYFRIAVRKKIENRKLIAELKKTLSR